MVRLALGRQTESLTSSTEMRLVMRSRVAPRPELYERHQRQHTDRGYRIEDERPIPVTPLDVQTAAVVLHF